MTLFVVLLLGAGMLLQLSALENQSLRTTFANIANGGLGDGGGDTGEPTAPRPPRPPRPTR